MLPSWAPSLPGSPAVRRVALRRARSLPGSVSSAAQQWSPCPGAGPDSAWKAAWLGTGRDGPAWQEHREVGTTEGHPGPQRLGIQWEVARGWSQRGASVTPSWVVGDRESWVTPGAQGLDGLPRGMHAVHRLRSGFVSCGLDVGTRVPGWAAGPRALFPCSSSFPSPFPLSLARPGPASGTFPSPAELLLGSQFSVPNPQKPRLRSPPGGHDAPASPSGPHCLRVRGRLLIHGLQRPDGAAWAQALPPATQGNWAT